MIFCLIFLTNIIKKSNQNSIEVSIRFLHFWCLLQSLSHYFGSFRAPFWNQKSFILSPWEALGTLRKTVPKKNWKRMRKARRCRSILEAILAPFFNDVWVDFWIRFLDHFWSHFGPILGAKMEPKSIKNWLRIRSKFQSDFGVVIGPFLSILGAFWGAWTLKNGVFV